MRSQLLIPPRINVGFQNRSDTYTKKLAYVIYYDAKGVLRKETSWQSWRDKKIKPEEFDNEPTEGFVLNKGVGGTRDSYGWNTRNEYIRVYDPRDFEFEISVENLLFILRECDCSKGKGLEGKFVYAWHGQNLVLLPVVSQDYKESRQFSDLQSQKVDSKELIVGASYLTKKQNVWIYLGKLDYYFVPKRVVGRKQSKGVSKRHVFWNGGDFEVDGLKNIAKLNSEVQAENFAELIQKYQATSYGSKIVRVFTKNGPAAKHDYLNHWYYEKDGRYIEVTMPYADGSYEKFINAIEFKDGFFNREELNQIAEQQKQNRYGYGYGYSNEPLFTYGRNCEKVAWVPRTDTRLWVELESGKQFRFTDLKMS